MLALILLRFLSGSLLAAMGEACGGIFQASQGFLAASRWNYMLAALLTAIFFLQLAFLTAGGLKLLRVSGRAKRSRLASGLRCQALSTLVGQNWSRRVFLVPDKGLQALTVGIFRPRILVHDGLVDELSADELTSVIAHEDAHRRGNDNLITAVARVLTLTLFYLPGPRLAYSEMLRALERAADLKAAGCTDRLSLAMALRRIVALQAERSNSKGSSLVAPSAAGLASSGSLAASYVNGQAIADVISRLEHLAAAEKAGSRFRLWPFAVFAISLTALLGFASSALAVTATDQKSALVCFTEHAQETADSGICELDHPNH